jgi:hypothetical protein
LLSPDDADLSGWRLVLWSHLLPSMPIGTFSFFFLGCPQEHSVASFSGLFSFARYLQQRWNEYVRLFSHLDNAKVAFSCRLCSYSFFGGVSLSRRVPICLICASAFLLLSRLGQHPSLSRRTCISLLQMY